MTVKLLLLVLAAAATWWLTRPGRRLGRNGDGRRRARRDNRRLAQCAKCGVYREEGAPCECDRG